MNKDKINKILPALKNFLRAHGLALISIVVLSICLKVAVHFSFILSFIILLVAYFSGAFFIELLLEKLKAKKGGKQISGTGRNAVIKPSPVRSPSMPVKTPENRIPGEDGPVIENRPYASGRFSSAEKKNTVIATPAEKKNTVIATPAESKPQNGIKKLTPSMKFIIDEAPAGADDADDEDFYKRAESQKKNNRTKPGLRTYSGSGSDFASNTNLIFQQNKKRNQNTEMMKMASKEVNDEKSDKPKDKTPKDDKPQAKKELSGVLKSTFSDILPVGKTGKDTAPEVKEENKVPEIPSPEISAETETIPVEVKEEKTVTVTEENSIDDIMSIAYPETEESLRTNTGAQEEFNRNLSHEIDKRLEESKNRHDRVNINMTLIDSLFAGRKASKNTKAAEEDNETAAPAEIPEQNESEIPTEIQPEIPAELSEQSAPESYTAPSEQSAPESYTAPSEQSAHEIPADVPAPDNRLEALLAETAMLEEAKREAERIETERLEAERAERERIEAERIERERQEAARIENEKREAERIEREEAERLEAERREAAKTDAERREEARLEARKALGVSSTVSLPDDAPKYILPSTNLMKTNSSPERRNAYLDPEDDPRAKKLIDTLASFGVGAKITAVIKGPAVTRYEIQPNPGVKVSKIVALSDDISLNLAATGVRIEAPIPGKEAVGIEVPNREVEIVYLRDVIESNEYSESSSKLTFAIGKDIAGKNIVSDIAKMPHLLIAGATGSGKSVCINTIIASILYKAGPEDVRLIMIDPKIVELGVYNGIPHLLVPVVTNPKKAAAALNWAVAEMERRYNDFSQFNVRDIKSYNALRARRPEIPGMPQIVIIIDELADLMMVAAKEIEDSIIRLAQKARAAGLHIVIATQRPSVDVITGLIKANIPSRIAFAVSSQIDSRTILDGAGAEKLLGRGDMLFHPIGMSKPLRVQGAFVSDGEIEALVSDVRAKYGAVYYNEDIKATMEAKVQEEKNKNQGSDQSGEDQENEDDSGDQEIVEQAAELAFEYKQLSTSFLQRKLKLGYSRASRIMDILEEKGLLSPTIGSKPRQLLMTKEEWEGVK